MEFDVKITAGLGSADDYLALVKAGVEEVFCGFVPFEWNRQFGAMQPLNRREVLFYHVQIGSYQEMKILKKMQQKYGGPIAITFNALYYTECQITCILSMMKKLIEIGFQDFIVCDLALILSVQKEQLSCNLHISGEIGEWNRYTLEMLLENQDTSFARIKRIIFHRKNTLKDMEYVIQCGKELCPDLEYEAFFMNEMCHFTGGFCNSLHCDEMNHMCQMPYELIPMKKESEKQDLILEKWKQIPWMEFDEELPGETGCGFCALWKLVEIGITHLKIVGRGKSIFNMKKDVKYVCEAVEIMKNCSSEEVYKKAVKQKIFKENCSGNCYYQEAIYVE